MEDCEIRVLARKLARQASSEVNGAMDDAERAPIAEVPVSPRETHYQHLERLIGAPPTGAQQEVFKSAFDARRPHGPAPEEFVGKISRHRPCMETGLAEGFGMPSEYVEVITRFLSRSRNVERMRSGNAFRCTLLRDASDVLSDIRRALADDDVDLDCLDVIDLAEDIVLHQRLHD